MLNDEEKKGSEEARKRGREEKRKKQSVKIWGIAYTWTGVVFIRGLLILVFSQLPYFPASCFSVGSCYCFEFRAS